MNGVKAARGWIWKDWPRVMERELLWKTGRDRGESCGIPSLPYMYGREGSMAEANTKYSNTEGTRKSRALHSHLTRSSIIIVTVIVVSLRVQVRQGTYLSYLDLRYLKHRPPKVHSPHDWSKFYGRLLLSAASMKPAVLASSHAACCWAGSSTLDLVRL